MVNYCQMFMAFIRRVMDAIALLQCRLKPLDSICGLSAVKPCLPQPKAAVSPSLISAAVIRERGKDYNRLLFALFEMAAFVLGRDTMRLAMCVELF